MIQQRNALTEGRETPRFATIAGVLAVLALLGACNTVSGVGKDVEATGEAISDTAEEVKN
jgi:predicted small secreted protein